MRIIGFTIIFTLCMVAGTVYAAVPTTGNAQFIPIAPIPLGEGGQPATSGNFSQYLNALFQIALAAGAALAAIFIAVGGFEYIISEATEAKHDGKKRITHALYGLAILLLVTIILYVINPDAICLNIFEQGGKCS